jgi:hypothetical protein
MYKGYAIIAAAKRDETSGKYKPIIHIAWHATDGRRDTHSFDLPARCFTFEEASALAVQAAKAWADRHAAQPQPKVG